MSAGFLCVLRKNPGRDAAGFEKISGEFPVRRHFEKNGGSIFWFSQSSDPENAFVLESFPDVESRIKDFPRSLASVDTEKGHFSVSTDALALQTIYVGTFPGIFIFSDSIPVIFKAAIALWQKADPDWNAANGHVHYGITPVGMTFVQQIRAMPGGRDFLYGFDSSGNPRALSEKTVRKIDFSKRDADAQILEAEYAQAFSQAVDRIMESTEGKPVGVLFSGGFDSSVVLNALLQKGKNARGGLVPLTAVNDGSEFVDEPFANLVTRELGLDRKTVRIEEWDFPSFFETISELGDGSESGWLGLLLKKVFSEGRKSWIQYFVSGSGTDAPMGSSVHILSALWNNFFGRTLGTKTMLETRGFSGDGKTLAEFSHFLEERPGAGFFREFEKNLTETLEFVSVPGKPSPAFIPAWIVEQYGRSNFSVHDLVTLVDLVTHSHRFSAIYSKMAKMENVFHATPFWANSTRRVLYGALANVKLNPSKHVVTTWDNQFFYKSALSEFVPRGLHGRTKKFGSFTDKSLWLFSDRFFPEIRSRVEKSLSNLEFGAEFSEKILRAYDRNFELEKSMARGRKISSSEQGFRIFLWRLLCVTSTMETFFPPKF